MPAKKVKVLITGAECAPFIKIGGLADVIGTLPKHLIALGLDVRVMIPFHKVIKEKYRMETEHLCHFYVPVGGRSYFVGIDYLKKDGVKYYFIDNEEMFGGPVYKGGRDEGEQYAFFCRALCESLDRIKFIPHIIHANDWQTGLIPLLIKSQYGYRPQGKAKTVYTIHNMQYQGAFGYDNLKEWLYLDDEYYDEYLSFAKAALKYSDWISTVSPNYAKEIATAEYGCGLDEDIKSYKSKLSGIVNGINSEEFNPEKDGKLACNYSFDSIHNKFQNKAELVRRVGLKIDPAITPVIGMVSRLVDQKGMDIVQDIIHELMRENVALVFLGTGQFEYENMLRTFADNYKGRIAAIIDYDDETAHLIYGGSDLFLMPSRFEPCGISQMIAQAYGTPPIVRKTGGLADTVKQYSEKTGKGSGIVFDNYSGAELLVAIRKGLAIISNDKDRLKLIQNVMSIDNSFEESAKKYRDMYLNIL